MTGRLPKRHGRDMEGYMEGYNRNDIKILYDMNKKAKIIVHTTVGHTESISIKGYS